MRAFVLLMAIFPLTAMASEPVEIHGRVAGAEMKIGEVMGVEPRAADFAKSQCLCQTATGKRIKVSTQTEGLKLSELRESCQSFEGGFYKDLGFEARTAKVSVTEILSCGLLLYND